MGLITLWLFNHRWQRSLDLPFFVGLGPPPSARGVFKNVSYVTHMCSVFTALYRAAPVTAACCLVANPIGLCRTIPSLPHWLHALPTAATWLRRVGYVVGLGLTGYPNRVWDGQGFPAYGLGPLTVGCLVDCLVGSRQVCVYSYGCLPALVPTYLRGTTQRVRLGVKRSLACCRFPSRPYGTSHAAAGVDHRAHQVAQSRLYPGERSSPGHKQGACPTASGRFTPGPLG